MEGSKAVQPGNGEVYEQMYFALLDYQLKRISFLEMLDEWEAILDIKSSQGQEEGQTELIS